MQLKNAPGTDAVLPIRSKSKDKFEIGFWNISCRFFGPLHQTH